MRNYYLDLSRRRGYEKLIKEAQEAAKKSEYIIKIYGSGHIIEMNDENKKEDKNA